MYRTDDILSTIDMVQEQKLDVRTITLGVDLGGCGDRDLERMCDAVRGRIVDGAKHLSDVCSDVSARYGIPIVNRRLAVTPISQVAHGHSSSAMAALARAINDAAAEVDVNLIGGYTALAQKRMNAGDTSLIASLAEALSTTERVCASANLASTRTGINIDAVLEIARALKAIAEGTADAGGFGCAKLVVFANAPDDNPFMAGAFLGSGEGDRVINVGVSGPGVVKSAVKRLLEQRPDATLDRLAEEIKSTAFRVTRVGELVGREVAERLGAAFGIVDLSLAPTPAVGDSVGEILEALGIEAIGGPGSTVALAMLNDAVKKGGSFASSSVGGLSGAFIPVAEDRALSAAAERGDLTLEKLEAMTSVCSVGLDMVAVPGSVDVETLAAIIADELAIGVFNHKTTAVRIIPVPGKEAGERVVFGGLFGESVILPVRAVGGSATFMRRGGRIPAPLLALRN